MSELEKTSELEAENKLLLEQLHQVQEELEYYFLVHKELSADASGRGSVPETQDTERLDRLVPSSDLLDIILHSPVSDSASLSHDLNKELTALQDELQSAYGDIKRLESANEQLRRQVDQQSARYQAEIDGLKVEWEQGKHESEKAIPALSRQRDTLAAELDGLNAAMEQQSARHQAEIERLKDEWEHRNHESEKAISGIVAEREALRSDCNGLRAAQERQMIEHEAAIAALRAERDAAHIEVSRQRDILTGRMRALEEGESRALQALGLAQKLQAKAQSDLDSLREKYKQKDENEHHLVDLIRQLRDKLQLASQYYQQLQEHHPDLLKD